MNSRLLRLLVWALWLPVLASAAGTHLSIEGISLGSTLDEVKASHPLVFCTTQVIKAQADLECRIHVGENHYLFDLTTRFINVKLIDGRVTEVRAVVFGNMCAVLPALKRQFGEPLRRYEFEDPLCGPGISEWQAGFDTLTVKGCIRDSCTLDVVLHDPRNAKLYAERERAWRALRPPDTWNRVALKNKRDAECLRMPAAGATIEVSVGTLRNILRVAEQHASGSKELDPTERALASRSQKLIELYESSKPDEGCLILDRKTLGLWMYVASNLLESGDASVLPEGKADPVDHIFVLDRGRRRSIAFHLAVDQPQFFGVLLRIH